MNMQTEDERDESERRVDDRRHLVNLDFDPFDDADAADDARMFEPGDIPE
jgi:hypothetical protein